LPSFSVTNALRKDQMRMRVHGIIDSIGNLFKLPTKVFFSCVNPKCPACGKRELRVLDRPIFQDADIEPIGFKGDYKEYRKNAKCPRCNEMRACQPNMRGFANVKVIELKNTSSDKVSVLTVNPELATEGLTTVVFNKHTLAVGLGEDVEIVGQFYIVEFGLASARYGTGRRANRITRGGSSYKADAVLYTERIKYTNKKQFIELTATDREILRRLAANTKSRVAATGRQKGCDLISVIKNLVAPQIYDKSEDNIAKLMLFLTALGAAPSHEKQNFYGERYWVNMGLVGDKGEGKTSLMEEGVNLRPGSQIVVAQHATGRSAVAVVEYDSLSGGARLRVGPVALANGRNCGIDEFQLFDYEDQDQFQTGMQSGRIPFAKAGIRQLIRTHTNFIITANPVGGSWKNKEQISLGEVMIKETLWDRLDFFVIFKSDTTAEARDKFSKKKVELAKIRLKPGYTLLQKLIRLIDESPRLQETKFNDPDGVERLRSFWNLVADKHFTIMGNRSFETVFRTASMIARAMLKTDVDSEVVDETIDLLTKMYRQINASSVTGPKAVDVREIAYLEICKVIKRYSHQKDWAKNAAPNAKKLADITFTQAAELASKENGTVDDYIGNIYKSNAKRAIKHLRNMFRERQDYDYEGGKIKVMSEDIRSEMKLRWIPNNESCDGVTV
jgi:DNA replicative helicase MCM subunit Mcm2 (Cdc46/Mcm family)